jgi:gliding motility-associated protein GldE
MAASEVAFFSLNHTDISRLRQQEKDDNPTAHRILRLLEMPRTLIATMLITNIFINIAIVIISDYVLKKSLEHGVIQTLPQFLVEQWHVPVGIEWLRGIMNFLITVVGVTFILVLFGEVMPKIYAKTNNIGLARMMSRPITFLSKIFKPFSFLLVRGTNTIERRLEVYTQSSKTTSREDIDKAIELTVSNEPGSKQELSILKSIVQFGDVTIKQIMRPRVDMVALDMSIDFKQLIDSVKKSGFSRYPVFEEDLDNIKGMLYSKDLLEHLDNGPDFNWQSLLRMEVFYAPEAKKIDELLREFKLEKKHLAIVVDEYGGTAGIITLEDIMEEVIGDIRDEFDDEPDLDYEKIDANNYIFEGKTLINDTCRALNMDKTLFEDLRGDADSLGGLMLEMIGYIPKKDAEIKVDKYIFKVVAVTKRKIEKIKLTIRIEK